ncbi:MAG: queuosine precursor transporter [Alphaproteobacteria bacterium]|nr:queuosine precursor transporter [Alphaproteobacteria bacterium]
MSTAVQREHHPLYERVYLVLASAFCVVLVLTNVVGIKLFQAPFLDDFALTTGILAYPATFVLTDLVSEIYGKKRADFMVGLGFAMSMLMLVIVQLAVRMPPHRFWVPADGAFYPDPAGYQHAFESVFALNGILLFASMLAYLCAQLCDNWLFHFWKQVTNGKHLWLRNNGSTWISQLVDTFVVGSILFWGAFGMSFADGLSVMLTIYGFKLVLAALDTPFVYAGVYAMERLFARDDT